MERLLPSDSKELAHEKVTEYLASLSISVASKDDSRPWGGFFVIDESNTDEFIIRFFPDENPEEIKKYGNMLSPKILLVQPGERLSWQYHNRRAEIWRVVQGPVGIVASETDEEQSITELTDNQVRQFEPLERHRLVGLENWGVVAEIWQHTDPNQPSDEDDIVRLNDSYGRQS